MSQRPPPADAALVAQLAKTGPIGRCLNEALNDLVSECFVEQVEQEVQESNHEEQDDTVKVPFDSNMAERVMNSFGRAVAESEWKDCPAALLRGRVDHYNKLEQKWRIVVEDAEIRPRVALEARKKQKRSLWEHAAASESSRGDGDERQQAIPLSGSLQILAYNDS